MKKIGRNSLCVLSLRNCLTDNLVIPIYFTNEIFCKILKKPLRAILSGKKSETGLLCP